MVMADVTPSAGRLLRALGLPQSHAQQDHCHGHGHSHSHCQRGCFLCSSGLASAPTRRPYSNGAASAAVDALHPAIASEPFAPGSFELEDWPSEPSTPSSSSATDSECGSYASTKSTSPTTFPSFGRRYSHLPPLGHLRTHTRTNSVDSNATVSSTASSSSWSPSRWTLFSPVADDLVPPSNRPSHRDDRRSQQAKEVWREYW
ncbi:hypothetical protein C8035_v007279 [Colletotrichum spinosum]|uniref:Uncharacterized protein n=1 Tax=Colletotrichum spinosum TaxID=1347390 RepID=A0A4R8QMF6_9PEZI|nr:hypothetical protein C8035_v007279 [Colletotrichum spinosum]